MKIKEVRELDTKDLEERLQTEIAKYNELKFNHSVSPLENPSEIRATRRSIARMKTVLRERELNK